MKPIQAWYFSTDDKRLRFDDGRLVEAGVTHTVDCKLILCKQGLHASKRIMDALNYAPGCCIWRVELGGEVIEGKDKVVGTNRKYLYGFDAYDLLRDFARRCALDVIDQWNAPKVAMKYLETGDPELRAAAVAAAGAAAGAAAEYAAEYAAWSAAWSAAGAAAWSAAGAAARYAAGSAAWSTAEYAAWSTAWSSARSEAKEKQNKRLTTMVCAAAKRQGLV